MYSWRQSKFLKYHVGMFLSQLRRFRVSLHGREHWDYIVGIKWGFIPVLCPPLHEGAVGADEETLLERWGLYKSIGDIGANDK
jgi:hypothetical protein